MTDLSFDCVIPIKVTVHYDFDGKVNVTAVESSAGYDRMSAVPFDMLPSIKDMPQLFNQINQAAEMNFRGE